MSGSTTVPTMDAFNAVVSKVDALNNRVTVLEHGNPPPPPPPPPDKKPSADGTTVTNTTGEIVDGKGRTFKLTGPASNYQISTDGAVSGGMVVRLYAKGGLCYQENVNHDWWVMPLAATTYGDDDWVGCPNPTGVAPPPPPPPTPPGPVAGVPKPAADVGFTKLTHGPDVTLGKNWFAVPGASNGVVQVSPGVVRDNGPINGGNWHYNYHFGTERNDNGKFGGVGFGGGGYFEIIMSIEGNIGGWPGNGTGWPAWWTDAVEGAYDDFPNPPGPKMQHIEYDAAEFLPKSNRDYSAGIIHWTDALSPPDQFNNNAIGQDSNVKLPSNNNFAARHKYAWLWVPATSTTKGYIKNYFDDQQVGATYTWTPYVSGDAPNTPGDPPWSIMDRQHCRLMIGTCVENPLTVYSVSVWQKDDSHNIRRGVSIPG